MNIIDAIKDEHLFRPFLADRDLGISTWNGWMAVLRCMYGMPVPESRHGYIQQVTGRPYDSMPETGFSTLLALTGRRCGKSRIASVLATYEAVLSGRHERLASGERGMVLVISPSKDQSRVVKDYIVGLFNKSPLLKGQIAAETKSSITLQSGVRIEIAAGSFATVRGYTLLAAVIDEACFFGMEEDSKVKSDTELVTSLKPALLTTGGPMIVISSPYAKRGWCYRTYQRNFGNPAGKVLVVNAPSMVLNPTLPQSAIDEALAEDYARARSEYYAEFRDDVGIFLPRSVIEACVVPGRKELLPDERTKYVAFCDVSGGRSDDATLAIAHRCERKAIIDVVKQYRPPFNPNAIIGEMVEELRRFDIRRITGDNYSAEFVASAFKDRGVTYIKADKPKSQLYAELLPRLCSGEVELLDNETLIHQLSSLERRTRSGGKDIIDHPSRGKDDVANSVAGVATIVCHNRTLVGAV